MSINGIKPVKGEIKDIRDSIGIRTVASLDILREKDPKTYTALFNIMTVDKGEHSSEKEVTE